MRQAHDQGRVRFGQGPDGSVSEPGGNGAAAIGEKRIVSIPSRLVLRQPAGARRGAREHPIGAGLSEIDEKAPDDFLSMAKIP